MSFHCYICGQPVDEDTKVVTNGRHYIGCSACLLITDAIPYMIERREAAREEAEERMIDSDSV